MVVHRSSEPTGPIAAASWRTPPAGATTFLVPEHNHLCRTTTSVKVVKGPRGVKREKSVVYLNAMTSIADRARTDSQSISPLSNFKSASFQLEQDCGSCKWLDEAKDAEEESCMHTRLYTSPGLQSSSSTSNWRLRQRLLFGGQIVLFLVIIIQAGHPILGSTSYRILTNRSTSSSCCTGIT